jgi:ribosome maturation factor RimP
MDIVTKITQAIGPSLEAMGYSVVLVKLGDGAHRKTLSVMAERTDGATMSFDDCAEISRTVSALLDVEDPITGAYNLEVCSPGIDRPLTRPQDFERYAGHEAKIETYTPIDGRKRFRGKLMGIKNELITVGMPEGEAEIPYRNIRTSKLVLTDELIESHLKNEKKQKKKG